MPTFSQVLASTIRAATPQPRRLEHGECQSTSSQRCRLCHAVDLEYEEELALKNKALYTFWQRHIPGTPLQPLVRSPRGREYRTVTKRKVFALKKQPVLGLIDPAEERGSGAFPVIRCAIEPEAHGRIYRRVGELIRQPYARALGEHLSYVIIKGSYVECSVIFNVRTHSPAILKAANTLSKSLTHTEENISGLFLYEEGSTGRRGGRFYMGRTTSLAQEGIRKIFGKGEIYQRIANRSFLYPPLSFSQTNQSIVEEVVTKAEALLSPSTSQTLFDLYCGYGLFSLCLAGKARSVTGVEIAAASVASAKENAKRQRVHNARFVRSDIVPASLLSIMKGARPDDLVLLDPPRGGTAAGVLECIAARRPAKILHLFCNIDLIPSELARWEQAGYRPTEAIPFDMFPGTASVEIMVLLEQRPAIAALPSA